MGGIILIAFVISTLFYGLLLMIKIDNTGKNRTKILDAIVAYTEDSGDYFKGIILLNKMEDFDDTLFRITDWGCQKILPKQYFELIEPYIQ